MSKLSLALLVDQLKRASGVQRLDTTYFVLVANRSLQENLDNRKGELEAQQRQKEKECAAARAERWAELRAQGNTSYIAFAHKCVMSLQFCCC